MLKVKAIVAFFDKAENKARKQGEIFEASVTRVNELNRKGRFIELVDEKTPVAKEK